MSPLEQAYRNTAYTVFSPLLTITIGALHPELDDLLRQNGIEHWVYITACNPGSILQTDEINLQKHNDLIEKCAGYPCFDGEGAGINGGWPPEKSLLVLGIELEEALEIAGYFKQNAFVAGEIGKPAELVWTNKDG